MEKLEDKVRILKEKCKENNFLLDDKVISLIAEKPFDIDELVDITNKVIALSKISNKDITEETISKAIRLNKIYKDEEVLMNIILNIVEQYFNVDFTNYNKNNKELIFARNIAIYLCREIAYINCVRIGKKFNIDSHLALHIYDNIKDEINNNNDTKNIIEELSKLIKNKC